MDNLVLQALVKELKPLLLRQYCVQALQVGPFTTALEFSGRASHRLIFDLAEPPLCFLTRKSSANQTPSAFVSLLRKWITGKQLHEISKNLDERILHLEFVGNNSSESVVCLVELIPHWGNVYLLDSENRVLGALLTSRAERRHLNTGESYKPPAKHGAISLEDFRTPPPNPSLPVDLKELTESVRGLSPLFARETLFRADRDQQTPDQALRQLVEDVVDPSQGGYLYQTSDHDVSAVPSPVPLRSLEGSTPLHFESLGGAVQTLFERRFDRVWLDAERRSLQKYVRGSLKRFRRIEQKLETERAAFSKELELQKAADLMMAQPRAIHPKQDELELADLFSPENRRIRIKIDPRLSVLQNAQRFYERAKRARRGVEKIEARFKSIHQTATTLDAILERLKSADSRGDLQRLSEQAQVSLSAPRESPRPRRSGPAAVRAPAAGSKKKCRVFQSVEGRQILVGRNSKENDLVTTRYAQPEDYWFHVADYAGSHVVLKNPDAERLEETPGFLEAAQLAAYFSQARNARKVTVHWTQKKFVKKPKRARPGLVTLSKFQSVVVEPKLPGTDEPAVPSND